MQVVIAETSRATVSPVAAIKKFAGICTAAVFPGCAMHVQFFFTVADEFIRDQVKTAEIIIIVPTTIRKIIKIGFIASFEIS